MRVMKRSRQNPGELWVEKVDLHLDFTEWMRQGQIFSPLSLGTIASTGSKDSFPH